MKSFYRLFTLMLVVLLLLPACAGPYGNKTAEVAEILRSILDRETVLLDYLYSDGFTTLTPVTQEDRDYTTTAVYYRVSADSPYHSVAELTEEIAGVYSENRTNAIKSGLFENSDGSFSRFCDYTGYADLAQTEKITDLQIDVTQNSPIYEFSAVIDLATLKVKRSTSTIIECTVSYTDERRNRTDDMTLKLLYEDGCWKLDSQTWAKGYIN